MEAFPTSPVMKNTVKIRNDFPVPVVIVDASMYDDKRWSESEVCMTALSSGKSSPFLAVLRHTLDFRLLVPFSCGF